MHFVIPGLIPYPVRGRLRNPVLFWIPAFAGMTRSVVIHGVAYRLNLMVGYIPPTQPGSDYLFR